MKDKYKDKYIVLSFFGHPDEGNLSVGVLEEGYNGLVNHHYIDWPFDDTGSSNFDEWFFNYADQSSTKDYGVRLYNEIIPKAIQQSLDLLINKSGHARTIFIKIRVGDHPFLKRIPFEILHTGNDYLQNINRIIIRYVDRNDIILKYRKEDFNKILIITADPSDCQHWDHDGFVNGIEAIINDKKFKCDIIQHAKIHEVKQRLAESGNHSRIYDAIIVGGLSLASIISGMHYRIKAYFFVGIGVLLLNVLLQTKSYWGNFPWWGYLILAGLTLIGFASSYELQKQKKDKDKKSFLQTKKEQLIKRFKDWN